MAIAAQTAAAPDRCCSRCAAAARRCTSGMAEDAFVVASEPYGLVEETADVPADGRRDARRSRARVGHPRPGGGPRRRARGHARGRSAACAFDGTPLPVQRRRAPARRDHHPRHRPRRLPALPAQGDLRGAGVVPQDAAREGRRARRPARASRSGPTRCPTRCAPRLRSGAIRRVVVIGQGTAAIAGQSLAAVARRRSPTPSSAPTAMLATELSGFQLRDDMSDTLVVAISQSGTTTDTNRTSTSPGRGVRAVVAIVNRRNSDLVDKSDGVLYTSDGRDVEMAVPSTKAFYAQVAAGYLLALAIADEVDDARSRDARARAPRRAARAPRRDARGARSTGAPSPRSRSATRCRAGTGPSSATGSTASPPPRCGSSSRSSATSRSRATSTEDKKHIDLSRRAADPRVRGRAAGIERRRRRQGDRDLPRPPRRADRDRQRRRAPLRRRAGDRSRCRRSHPDVGFVLSAMAGHLFGYEAALAIDTSARPLREARAAIQATVSAAVPRRRPARAAGGRASEGRRATFLDGLRVGSATTGTSRRAPRCSSRRCCATRPASSPLDVYEVEHGKVGTPSRVVEDLTAALTKGIKELTRPVDTIKHQAKTVTVGISRSDEELLQVALAREVLAAGAARDALSYRVVAHAGRARSGRRAGRRVHPVPHRGRPRRRRRDHPRRRPRRHLGRSARRAPTTTRASRDQAPRRDPARGHGRRAAGTTGAR